MSELVNLYKESPSSYLSRQLVPQTKELKESARTAKEEKLFTLDANENELYEESKGTITFATKIEIVESAFAYNCDICYEEFQNESELNAHDCSRALKEEPPFRKLSDIGYPDETGKKMHLKVKEEDSASLDVWEKNPELKISAEENPYACVCDICKRGFGNESEMIVHLRTHKRGRKPYCGTCERNFASFGHLKSHLRTHSDSKYACEECPEKFSHRYLFQKHVRNHARPFGCTVCDKKFPDEFKMKMHLIGHSVDAPFVCDICKREFSKKQHLVRHIYIHTGERPFVCEFCNRGFYRPSELKIHTLTHDKEKQIRCKFCQKCFLRKNSLMIHLRNHTGEKPFVCSVCKKAFSQACDLRIHSFIHTGERPFVCDVCNKGFYKKSFLVNHRRTHDKANHPAPNVTSNHVEQESTAGGEKKGGVKTTRGRRKRFLCKFCQKGYLTQRRLKMHLRNHSKEAPFVCAVCHEEFHRAFDLKNHSGVHLKRKPFLCDICNERFSRKCGLTKHRRTHEKGNHRVREETIDDLRPGVSLAGKIDNHSTSNKASDDYESLEGESANHFITTRTCDDSHAEVFFVEEKWFSAQKNSRTRCICKRRIAIRKLPKEHSSQSHPKSKAIISDARQKEISSEGKKISCRQSKGKSIGPGSFACNECDKVYSHYCTLRQHLRTHKLEATGVHQTKSPIETFEENVHLFAPFKNFV